MNNEPTDGELKILRLIWNHGPLTVREAHDRMDSDTGYTTTLKMMQIMTDKGLLGRKAKGRGHIYHSLVDQKKTTQSLLDKFVEMTYGGSTSHMMMQLLGSRKTSQEELNKIKDIIDDFENNEMQKP